jgi:glucose-6-phosphate isomerase
MGDIALRDGSLKDISGVRLSDAFRYESEGTIRDALDNKIPVGTLDLEKVNEETVAYLIAFWHYMAVYSSWLRGVNPFDQPQVEKSKEIAFGMRKG